jgi:hypothetical protein
MIACGELYEGYKRSPTVERLYAEILPPTGANIVSKEHRSTVKSSVVHFGDAYDTTNPGYKILDYYSRSLVQHGWIKYREEVDQHGNRHFAFCKDDYNALVVVWPEIEEVSAKSERRYYFSMGWTSTWVQKTCT